MFRESYIWNDQITRTGQADETERRIATIISGETATLRGCTTLGVLLRIGTRSQETRGGV